jgi:hypothetical protein
MTHATGLVTRPPLGEYAIAHVIVMHQARLFSYILKCHRSVGAEHLTLRFWRPRLSLLSFDSCLIEILRSVFEDLTNLTAQDSTIGNILQVPRSRAALVGLDDDSISKWLH